MSVAIRVENLSKAYQIGQIGTGTISRDIERWFVTRVMGREDPFLKLGEVNDRTTKSESNVVWSLKDINLEIQQGDAIGIIGRNGAGKSTLLKLLSRVTAPTTGRIKIMGRVASLLEVGTGFHPELTGRENIYLNGSILGMRKREIDRKLDEIVDFSGVERYIDTPVKRYSSGMSVRLAFAVAAHLESEILIVDEVLAVGDVEFQKKCLGKMDTIHSKEGRTIMFVSHNMAAVQVLCNKGIILENGTSKFAGTSDDAVKNYSHHQNESIGSTWVRPALVDSPPLRLEKVKAKLTGFQPTHLLNVELECVSSGSHRPGLVALDVVDENETTIMQIIPSEHPFIGEDTDFHKINIEAALPPMIPGIYRISAWIGSHHNSGFDQALHCVAFEIMDYPDRKRTFPYARSHGSIIAPSRLLPSEAPAREYAKLG